jgi:hypothetical protein
MGAIQKPRERFLFMVRNGVTITSYVSSHLIQPEKNGKKHEIIIFMILSMNDNNS